MNQQVKSKQVLYDEFFARYPSLHVCQRSIDHAFERLLQCFKSGKKLLVAGNGGSAADSEHISGELMKSFLFKRKIDQHTYGALQERFGEKGRVLGEQLEGALQTVPLTSFPAVSTAFANDVNPSVSFAQMLYGLGSAGDVFLAVTTSGNSENLYQALMVARAKELYSICLTGQNPGQCANLCDLAICVPESETFRIQEFHLPIYHTLCAMLEAEIFGQSKE